jgi:hypothetical protein
MRNLLFTTLFLVSTVALAPPPASGAVATAETVNVTEFGAKGDGKTDDTKAFLKAVEQAVKEKKPVFVPLGQYVISRPIALEQTAITGPSAGAWPADIDALPSILPTHRDGPAFHLLAGGGLAGLDITYNWDKEPESGPPAILISGVGVSVRDTRIRYAWDGIMADGENNVGRTNIENVFMATIRNVGVRMTGTWDVPRLNNVEVWNAGAPQDNRPFQKGVGFLLGKNDLIRMTDCFVFGMHYGFLLESKIEGCSIEGETWGVMNGCATDFCAQGIVIRGDHTLSVSGGSFWDHQESVLAETGQSRIRVSGSELKSNGSPAVVIENCDHTVVTGCSVIRPMKEYDPPAVSLRGGRTVLGSNHIESHGIGVDVGPNIRSAVIQGNLIDPHGNEGLRFRGGAKDRATVAGNRLFKTEGPEAAGEPRSSENSP